MWKRPHLDIRVSAIHEGQFIPKQKLEPLIRACLPSVSSKVGQHTYSGHNTALPSALYEALIWHISKPKNPIWRPCGCGKKLSKRLAFALSIDFHGIVVRLVTDPDTHMQEASTSVHLRCCTAESVRKARITQLADKGDIFLCQHLSRTLIIHVVL